jgi:inorganic pyrophosphatase
MEDSSSRSPTQEDLDFTVLVRIENRKGSVAKYEWSEKYQCLMLDRMLHGPEQYRFNYGEILDTMGGDGDAVDAVVLTEPKLVPASLALCRVVGLLETTDEKGRDEKVIVVPVKDPDMDYVNDIGDVSVGTRAKIRSFFATYKNLEKDKFVEVGDFKGRKAAIDLVKSSLIKCP